MTKDNFSKVPNCPRSLTDFFTNWDCILSYDEKGVHLTIPLTGTHPEYVFKRARGRINDQHLICPRCTSDITFGTCDGCNKIPVKCTCKKQSGENVS